MSDTNKNISGFTLVELAIVLMIIGLLIAGVLRGQELMNNSRASAFIQQVRSYEAGIASFQDAYGALPGDLTNPSTRLANCTNAPCNVAGNSNGIVGLDSINAVGGFNAIASGATDENRVFWVHLAKAKLINKIKTEYSGTPNTFGVDYPSIPQGGGFVIGFTSLQSGGSYYGPRNGHYLMTTKSVIQASGALNNQVFSAQQAAYIDNKIDDGNPSNAQIWSYPVLNGGTSHCYDVVGTKSVYAESETSGTQCNMIVHIL